MAGLLKRISSAVSASVHDALDSAESPDSVIRQLIRESSDNVTRARTLTVEAVASEKRLGQEIEQSESAALKWKDAAKAAMATGDEDSARTALAKKIELENQVEALKPQHATALKNSDALKKRIVELEQSLADLKSKKAALVARQKGAEAIREADNVSRSIMSTTDINEKVLRAEELVADLEAQNAAEAEVNSVTNPEIDLNAKLSADQVERELNALRN